MNDARHDPAADAEHTRHDLRTLPERERNELDSLRQLCGQQADALDYLTRRVDALEAATATLRGTVGAHDETLQVITLRGDDGR